MFFIKYMKNERTQWTKIAKDCSKEDCGFVYCHTTAETEVVAANLQTANINCKAYHRGLSAGLKTKLQSLWANGSLGIDRPNNNTSCFTSIDGRILSGKWKRQKWLHMNMQKWTKRHVCMEILQLTRPAIHLFLFLSF